MTKYTSDRWCPLWTGVPVQYDQIIIPVIVGVCNANQVNWVRILATGLNLLDECLQPKF